MESVECGVRSVKYKVWSVECTVKCGVWSAECGEESVECGVWSVKWEVWSVECGVRSVKCKVWSVECRVWSAELPHRHGDATGKPETRNETRGCKKTSISCETSSKFDIFDRLSNRLECHKVPHLPRKTI